MRISGLLFTTKDERPDLRPASLGDEVYTPSPRRSEGWRANLGSLSEPRHEQNLSANPKRTAKFIRCNLRPRNLALGSKKIKIFFVRIKLFQACLVLRQFFR
jgi:hypothetical protein